MKLDDVEEEDEEDVDDTEDEEAEECDVDSTGGTNISPSTSVQVHPYNANEQSIPSPIPEDSSLQEKPQSSTTSLRYRISPTTSLLSSSTKDNV